jgi:signal transduction histidine kinase
MRVEARRALLVDSVVGFALALTSWMASFYVWAGSEFGRPEWRHGPPREMVASVDPSPWVLPAVSLVALGVATRRIWPRAAFIATVVGVGGYLATGSTFAPIFLGPALAVYSMAGGASIFADRTSADAPGRRLPPLHSWAPLLVLLVPMIMAGYWQEPYLGLLDPAFYGGLLSVIAIALVPAVIALLVRSRRESEREVREQERRRYAYEERLRIARDVHDVVGHSLAVITMQAGVALHLLDKERAAHPRPDQVASSLEAIKKTSREALAELRTTLEVFRADAEEPRSPLPGLDRLDDLIDGLSAAGRDVTLIREQPGDDLQEVPAAVDQAAFRIIQESLTNIVRHAPAAHATVRLTRQAGTLTIEVYDDGPAVSVPPDGNGIRGMRERARAVGGAVRVSAREPSGLAVRAELPLVGGEAR